jgi:hypothetical protein
MGGYGSTRWGGRARRCTVEESLHLSASNFRSSVANPHTQMCQLGWYRDRQPYLFLKVYFATRTSYRHSLTFSYSLADGAGADTTSFTIASALVARPMRFGGVRWWLECPRCCRLCSKLYLPLSAGGKYWWCRRCYGLKYATQRLEPTDRAATRMCRIVRRLHPTWADALLELPPKPKRMHSTTYAKHVRAWERASEAREWALNRRFSAFLARLHSYRILR